VRRSVVTLIVGLLAVLSFGASSAFATTTVSKPGTVIIVQGIDDVEDIDVSIDASDGTYVFSDDGDNSDVQFMAPCTQSSGGDAFDPSDAECPIAGTDSFDVQLLGGDDILDFDETITDPATVEGGAGDEDCIWGTAANDTLNGGPGDDCLVGEVGDDTLNGGSEEDSLFGEEDNDTLNGDAGEDGLFGGDDNDTLNGGAEGDFLGGGDGDDDLFGGADDDNLEGDAGVDDHLGEGGDDYFWTDEPGDSDVYNGGDGFDEVDYGDLNADQPAVVTLDGQANDGSGGENDNVLAMEDVDGGLGNDELRGSTASESSIFFGDGGNDTIDPGSLEDIVFGADGDDTIATRDGFADRVSCGAGTDTANVDQLDIVSPDCETINVEQRAASRDVPEDAAPTVAFTSPAPNARLTARTTLTATATDDRGVARVLFVDEERTVCSDETAPYTCDYQPRGEDVGRNTLIAVAVDTANQTAFAARSVRVPRFRPGLSINVRPRTDRTLPFRFTTTGRLTLPTGVTPALGCTGTVNVQIKSRGNTISTRRAPVRPNCRYTSRVTFRVLRRIVTDRLTVRVRFTGNEALTSRTSRRVGVLVRARRR
jgi:Ca2+-binding RTX toxin-like protein